MKTVLGLKSVLIKGIVSTLAICYLISPLKEPVLNGFHKLSHYISALKLQNTHSYHSHQHSHEHHHQHSEESKTQHSHHLISFFDTIFEASKTQNEHQKSTIKYDIDKHILTSNYQLNHSTLLNFYQNKWPYRFPSYECYVSRISPPPKYVS